jgi:hypothetical protein
MLQHRLLLLAAAAAAVPSSAWLALSPVDPASGKVTAFALDDKGARGADTLSFPLMAGEAVLPNSFACGRCFCLVLGTNEQAHTSTLYNFSFCIVPVPALESILPLGHVAYNLHSGEGEGDGGNGYSVMIDRSKAPPTFEVIQVVGAQVNRMVDISPFVDAFGGTIFPGGTAFCAETLTMWVAVQTRDPTHDTLVTVDLVKKQVVGNVSIVKPALAAHFADCSTNRVGGFTLVPGAGGAPATVQMGMLSAAGAFTVLDQAALPAGSSLQLAGIADFLHDPRWNPSEYGALLYSGWGEKLPGAIFVSSGKMGSAQLNPLNTEAASIAVAY